MTSDVPRPRVVLVSLGNRFLKNQRNRNNVDKREDIGALGVLIRFLLIRSLPAQVIFRVIVSFFSINFTACINPFQRALVARAHEAFWDFEHFP